MARKSKKGKYSSKPSKSENPNKTDTMNKEGGTSGSESTQADVPEKSTNNPEWYAQDPQLVIDSASVPFSTPLGSPFSIIDGIPPTSLFKLEVLQKNPMTTAGIMTFKVKPSFGKSFASSDPANVSASAFYSQVRYVNNGRKNYDPTDLFMYLHAITELYSFVSWVQRIYSAAFVYSQANQYIGEDLLKAMHVIPATVRENLANFRYWMNTYINKVSSFVIPANIPLIYRRAFQYANLYIEHEGGSLKDQLYMYIPDGFFKFKLDEMNKGMLEYQPLNYGLGLPVSSIMSYGDSLLENIWGDEDFGLMCGDVLRAFNGDIVHLNSVPEEMALLPVYDPLVLAQMENSVICPVVNSAGNEDNSITYKDVTGVSFYKPGNIYQDGMGHILCREALYRESLDHDSENGFHNGLYSFLGKLLNLRFDQTNPAYILEAVQNMVNGRAVFNEQQFLYDGNPNLDIYEINGGASIITRVEMWVRKANYTTPGERPVQLLRHDLYQVIDPSEGVGFDSSFVQSCTFAFKYAPKVFAAATDYDAPHSRISGLQVINNLDMFAVVGRDTLDNMLQTSLLSLLFVPGVAKFTNTLGGTK